MFMKCQNSRKQRKKSNKIHDATIIIYYWVSKLSEIFQPLKPQTKIAADDILIFYFYLSKKIRLDVSSESAA